MRPKLARPRRDAKHPELQLEDVQRELDALSETPEGREYVRRHLRRLLPAVVEAATRIASSPTAEPDVREEAIDLLERMRREQPELFAPATDTTH